MKPKVISKRGIVRSFFVYQVSVILFATVGTVVELLEGSRSLAFLLAFIFSAPIIILDYIYTYYPKIFSKLFHK